MHVRPVDKYKAIRRIDKCIGEMATKQIVADKASEANSAETHQETMNALFWTVCRRKTRAFWTLR